MSESVNKSFKDKIDGIVVLPVMLFDSTVKKDLSTLSISPTEAVVDSSVIKQTMKGGRKPKKTVRPKIKKVKKMKGGETETASDLSATAELIRDIQKPVQPVKTASDVTVEKLSSLLNSSSFMKTETAIDINSESSDIESSQSNDNKQEIKQDETQTEDLINKLDNINSVSSIEVDESSENTVKALMKHADKQLGGVDELEDDDDDDDEDEDDDEGSDFEMSGGNFNDFINGLFEKKGGRKHSKEAYEYNKQITDIIKKVYPDITVEELKAVKSEIYQKIREKYDVEAFKLMKDFEKSKLLLDATTPEVVKKINLKSAVENRRKRIEDRFGKKDEIEETPGESKKDELKELKKKDKKEKKSKKVKKTRGGAIDDKSIELPFMINNKGGCNCSTGGCNCSTGGC